MSLKISLLAAIVGTAAFNAGPQFSCNSTAPSPELLALHKKLGEEKHNMKRDELSGHIDVGIYIHVVASNFTATGGWLDVCTSQKYSTGTVLLTRQQDTTIQKQMEVLNAGFAPSNISFSVQGVDKTINSSWTSGSEQLTMKRALHRGDYRVLNLYFLPNFRFAGECFFPNMNNILNPLTTDDLVRDGCTIRSNTVPGGPAPYDMGKTAVHEVGHWFGLLHTFSGGCDEVAGDYISDTPAQKNATDEHLGDGCPIGRDSCPELPGLDPIHNYMDYSSDKCYTEFTPEQKKRMKQLWKLIRFGTIRSSSAVNLTTT
ncbi:hypothetical protein QQS21_002482 [Conoideocrella luteorostrata]|uniref:Peptidase M43 pregnancy-associated plasma-A domain-containing protein n=1 Tax=Conoideocrella luteorostrata TaxID=1105319 RepID=A0AAJ0FWJ8_9HYPO|nr:hypothetical protein QQS21_002482 [Conoideocrella luteorostrata]